MCKHLDCQPENILEYTMDIRKID
nr:hypothetical protein [Candidatus Paracaedibacter symbiosus]